ncbi:MAG TPA: hypothetical protein VHV83_17530 [Armatimonadota bacterium]|nr:hypothetical protein [Armatimonadota bacterium]
MQGKPARADEKRSSEIGHRLLQPSLCLTVLFLWMASCFPVQATSLTLPPTLPSQNPCIIDFPFSDINAPYSIDFGASGGGNTNIGPIFDITEDHQAPHSFSDHSAFATLDTGYWSCFRSGRWFIIAGSGNRQQYQGNRDAGQIWIDTHSDTSLAGNKSPQLAMYDLQMKWYGIGYQMPYRHQNIHGTTWVMARYLDPQELLMGTAIGDVDGSDYTGMVRLLSTKERPQASGRGWALDAGFSSQIGRDLRCSISAEGLLGEITWKNISVSDLYVSSPRVFEDPNGFFHDYFDAEGAQWREDLHCTITPVVTTMVGYGQKPMISTGIRYQNKKAIPIFGAAMPWPGHGTSFIDIQPTYSSCEIGYSGKHGAISLLFNGLPQTAKNASIQLRFNTLSF